MSNTNPPTLGNGKICYVELPAIDITMSATFYKNVFGWQTRVGNDGRMAFNDGVGEVAGAWMIGRKPMTETGMLIYIMVDDMMSIINAIITNGGRIVQEVGMDAPEITARFSDPAGNVLGLYQQPK
jgi:predicted enzyme related to lactoylglutathione lyase